ncbi:MAG: 3-deoxy-D-manno-octulosonic acid transferase [Candidatus Binatia bacterium]
MSKPRAVTGTEPQSHVGPVAEQRMAGSHAVSYAVYDLVGSLLGLAAAPLLPLLLLTRHGRGLGERLGHLPAGVRRLRRPIWIHAASVGEVLSAQPLVQQLRRQAPDLPVVVSTTTVTGRNTARARLAPDAVMLLPADLRWIANRVVRRLAPRCLVIVETEMWPALIRAAARYHVPCLMVSGRVSERAAVRYRWFGRLTRAVLSNVSACAMQTDADAARIVALGAPVARVQVLGSLKCAGEVAAAADTAERQQVRVLTAGRPLLIAASTHRGEEQLVLDACAGLWALYPELLLVVAPRRPERFDEVNRLLNRTALRHERRSAVRSSVRRTTQVLLLDSVGELRTLLPAATAVFVGGTLVAVGGHNVSEPALFGKPVLFGPHTAKVSAAAQALLESAGARRVSDARELRREWQRLLACPEAAAHMGARARTVVAAHAAVAERTVALIRQAMSEPVTCRV